jgi:hypothetical protein
MPRPVQPETPLRRSRFKRVTGGSRRVLVRATVSLSRHAAAPMPLLPVPWGYLFRGAKGVGWPGGDEVDKLEDFAIRPMNLLQD